MNANRTTGPDAGTSLLLLPVDFRLRGNDGGGTPVRLSDATLLPPDAWFACAGTTYAEERLTCAPRPEPVRVLAGSA